MNILRNLDDALNRITMYKLVAVGLSLLIALAIAFSFSGALPISGLGLLLSTGILMTICFVVNQLLAWLYRVPYNFESSLITALILICILPPVTTFERAIYAALCGVLAIASKYIVTWRHKHIFNPAAFGAAAMGLLGLLYATWWIGNPTLFPFTLLLGLLVVRKIRRFSLFLSFVCISLATWGLLMVAVNHQDTGSALQTMILSGPLLFLGAIMLTEPSTMPPTRYYQVLYGLLVGGLFAAQLHIGTLSISPQLALIIGNLFAYSVSFRQRIRMTFQGKRQLTADSYDFIFTPSSTFNFRPGQYAEWTIADSSPDWRGNRRTFTIASAPTEQEVHLGVKFHNPGSSFKSKLSTLQTGDSLEVGNIAGDFCLPNSPHKNLVWIAGGIGITPFRSMAAYLVDKQQHRDVVLFYVARSSRDVAYRQELAAAASVGVRTIYVLEKDQDKDDLKGPLRETQLQQIMPDYASRIYYLSGPPGMVRTYRQMLRRSGIPAPNIITDYFSGY
jgi:ferredoxin-NADP reductase/Na+-translocating ferredoxin:NAD+ oxidoreductase RnfD subunit